MPTLASVTDFRRFAAASNDIPAERLDEHLRQAGRKLRLWVGAECYQAALDLQVDEDTPWADTDRRDTLELAEKHLAMHYGVRSFNTELRPQGMVLSEKAEGATGLTFHTPAQIAQMEAGWLASAQEIARPYLLPVAQSGEVVRKVRA